MHLQNRNKPNHPPMARRLLAACLTAACLSAACLSGCARQTAPQTPTYTLNEYLTDTPTSWSPLTRTASADTYLAAYTEIGLVDAAYDPATGGAKWVYELADAVEDVTAEEPETLARFGLSGSEGLVWKISLNPDAKWENGTPINADTYVDSMKLLLDPQKSNAQAARFCTGSAALAHADAYHQNARAGEPVYGSIVTGTDDTGAATYAPAYTDVSDAYLNPDQPCALLGGKKLADEVARYRTQYACFEALAAYCGTNTYTPVTDALRATLTEVAARYGRTDENAWLGLCFCKVGIRSETPWEQVGLYRGADDTTLYYVCAAPTTRTELFRQLRDNWILDTALYAEKGTYATSTADYRSFGPYRLVSADKTGLTLTRNEAWYGYTDGQHKNEYQTTDIRCRILSDAEEVLRLFNQGELDTVSIASDDSKTLLTYQNSLNILRTESTYTKRLIFATDRDALAALSSADPAGGSRLLLSYPAFREAISWAIDRADYVKNGTVRDLPALGLFSGLYASDAEDPAAVYRLTDPARAALCNAYGAADTSEETAAALTGYDRARAAALFTETYEQALAAGDVAATGIVRLRCAVEGTTLTETQERQQQLLQKYLDEATVGTPLENRLRITFVCMEDRYTAVSTGAVELAIGAWGGAATNPYSLIRCYTDPAYTRINEQCGFDPTTESCTITVDGTAQTRTFYAWGASLNAGGDYAQADPAVRVQVLAGLEQALIARRCFVVLSTTCTATLFSDQIRYAADRFNLLSGYGGVRALRYHYSDRDWAAYVKDIGGTLDYTAADAPAASSSR